MRRYGHSVTRNTMKPRGQCAVDAISNAVILAQRR